MRNFHEPQLYSEEEAQEEASLMQGKIETGEAKNYTQAESFITKERKEKEELINNLIEEGDPEGVIDYLPLFFDHTVIAKKLIEATEMWVVTMHLKEFHNLDFSVAEKLIDAEEDLDGDSDVAEHIESFRIIDHSNIANKLIEAHQEESLISNLDKFKDLDLTIANKFINIEKAHVVAENLDKFKDLDSTVANKLIEAGSEGAVAAHLEEFHNLDHVAIANKLIDAGAGRFLAAHLYKFHNLDLDIAEKLIAENLQEEMDENLGSFNLPLEIQNLISSHYLFMSEAIIIFKNKNIKDKSIFNTLYEKHPTWKDEENIAGPFREGSQIFSEEKMFYYLNRPNLSRHDGLHQFRKIGELFRASGLSENEFYNNILLQVASDDGEYYSGTAHHELNALAQAISLDFPRIQEEVAQYSHIQKLIDLFAAFSSPQDIFASWKNLKKYKEVQDLLAQKDVLEKLSLLKDQPEKEKLRAYIETLAFHPNISMEKVMLFWQDPEAFLELEDSHTPQKIHDRKKPSNYVEFPNLDLTAEDLRDALVEGVYDTLQAFHPFVIDYVVGDQEISHNLRENLVFAIGKRTEGIKGAAKDAPKLFFRLQKLFNTYQVSFADYLAGKIEKLQPKLQTEIENLLDDEIIGLPKKDGETYRAKINKKSDPDGVVAGNDTACCMPFGSGKNNVYTFNPDCALFTIQKKIGENAWRTVAQSVLTKDRDINKNVADVVEDMKRDDVKLHELIDESLLIEKSSVIACDNIEVAPNYKKNERIIYEIYEDFFQTYLEQFALHDKFDNTHVVIGQGYTDALTSLPKIANTFVPEAPVGYSDKLGEKVYNLEIKNIEKTLILQKKIGAEEKASSKDSIVKLPQGVSALTFEDALPVSYIEGKAYASNSNLLEYLHTMENALIAKDVNNTLKNRPNMSFRYQDEKKKMHGYILAYEGKVGKIEDRVVYVSDIASDGNSRAGGSLILAFTEAYKKNYLEKGDFIPIYAQMREETSYKIITKQLEKLSAGTGVNFAIKELNTYEVGNDTMHEVMIQPEK